MRLSILFASIHCITSTIAHAGFAQPSLVTRQQTTDAEIIAKYSSSGQCFDYFNNDNRDKSLAPCKIWCKAKGSDNHGVSDLIRELLAGQCRHTYTLLKRICFLHTHFRRRVSSSSCIVVFVVVVVVIIITTPIVFSTAIVFIKVLGLLRYCPGNKTLVRGIQLS